jgi:hypothetical protein
MFKKLNPLSLLALLALLAVAAVLIIRHDTHKKQGSFVRELVIADRNKITSIVIIPKGMTEDVITIEKKNDHWMAGTHGKMFNANMEQIDQIFRVITPMIPKQLVSRDKENWAEYEVTDMLGTRVKIYEGKRLIREFIFGKLDFQQQMVQGQPRPILNTFVRLAGQDDVYLVDGFLGSAFPGILKQYRDQGVIRVRADEVEKISVTGNDFADYNITREGAVWLFNGMPADSANMAFYINSFSDLRNDAFVEAETEGWLNIPSHTMTIQRKTEVPVEIRAYPADTTYRYFITSTQNPGAVFNGSHNDLFESIFYPIEFFIGAQEEIDPLE